MFSTDHSQPNPLSTMKRWTKHPNETVDNHDETVDRNDDWWTITMKRWTASPSSPHYIWFCRSPL